MIARVWIDDVVQLIPDGWYPVVHGSVRDGDRVLIDDDDSHSDEMFRWDDAVIYEQYVSEPVWNHWCVIRRDGRPPPKQFAEEALRDVLIAAEMLEERGFADEASYLRVRWMKRHTPEQLADRWESTPADGPVPPPAYDEF